MNVTTYFKKHGFIFGLDIDTNPITVKIFSDMETAVSWSKTGKILCSKSIAVVYSNRTAINQLINSVKTQSGGAQAPLMRAKAVATPLRILKADKAERGTI